MGIPDGYGKIWFCVERHGSFLVANDEAKNLSEHNAECIEVVSKQEGEKLVEILSDYQRQIDSSNDLGMEMDLMT